MANEPSISAALSQTLKDSNLHRLAVDVSEALLDTLIEPGWAKDIPVLGSVYNLCRVGLSIRDRLFLKKLVQFLAGIAEVPPTRRAEIISRIESSAKYQLKVGEKLLFILDKCEDHENARIIASLFSAFLSEELDYDRFLRASRAVQSLIIDDLWEFVDGTNESWDIPAGDLLNAGLIELDELSVRVQDQWDYKSSEKYCVEGGNLSASITPLGRKLREVLRSRCRSPERRRK